MSKEDNEVDNNPAEDDNIIDEVEQTLEDTTVNISELMSENNERLADDLKEFKDKYFRAIAEMDNMRKRLQNEKQDMISFAIENLITEFLSPLDNLENALGFTDKMSEETLLWSQGFQMILTQFRDVLSNHGITCYHSTGKAFDPHLHEAVEMEETDSAEEGTVIREMSKGYKLNNRVIRAARVVVAKGPQDEKVLNTESEE
jgi:molecular chaperone GrpE